MSFLFTKSWTIASPRMLLANIIPSYYDIRLARLNWLGATSIFQIECASKPWWPLLR